MLKSVVIVCTFISAVLIAIFLNKIIPVPDPYPWLSSDTKEILFYGRETEQKMLLDAILENDDKIIMVIGIPGVGKTALVRNTTEKLIQIYGYCVIYVEASQHVSLSLVQYHIVNNHQCMSLFNSIVLIVRGYYYDHDRLLQLWYESLNPNSVLILDDIDMLYEDRTDEFMDPKIVEQTLIEPLSKEPKKKIVLVSHFIEKKYILETPIIKVYGMDLNICEFWINKKFTLFTPKKGKHFCNVLGGIPSHIETILRYVSLEISSEGYDDVLDELNNPDHQKAYNKLKRILKHSKHTDKQIDVLQRLYKRLKNPYKVCAWKLVKMKGSEEFTLDHAKEVLEHENIDVEVDDCLKTLLSHCFLDTRFAYTKQFMFLPVVRNFIESKGEPEPVFAAFPTFGSLRVDAHDKESIATDITQALTTDKIEGVIDQLHSPEFAMLFEYLEAIIVAEYRSIEPPSKVMHLLYNRLNYVDRKCIWLLVETKGSTPFTKDAAEQFLIMKDANISVNDCLKTLLTHSFLEAEFLSPVQFKFHPRVIKFIDFLGEPSHDISAKYYFLKFIKELMNRFKCDFESKLQLAIGIGSNVRLINSFLPILGDEYDLKPLFKMALEVIEDHYCTPTGIHTVSSAKALLAFSYLTKAIHCPMIHPPELLLQANPSISPKDNTCFLKLDTCPAIRFNIQNDDYESAEAIGYHNSLLIYALQSVHWKFYFTDLSLMVTTANYECVQYCKANSCHCGKETSIEHGLREYLFGNLELSTRYFHATLHKFSKHNRPCLMILRVLSLIGIYTAETGDARKIAATALNSINFDQLDISCMLGVTHDIILPFLFEISWNESQKLSERLNKTIEEAELICKQVAKTDEERLNCSPMLRYTVAYGIKALKMKQIQDELKWPQKIVSYTSREEWVCSIIQDKTIQCEEHLPLLSQVHSINTTSKTYDDLQLMNYFMDEDKFKRLYEKAKSIPGLFLLMSEIR